LVAFICRNAPYHIACEFFRIKGNAIGSNFIKCNLDDSIQLLVDNPVAHIFRFLENPFYERGLGRVSG
jgi:hypothetical protein